MSQHTNKENNNHITEIDLLTFKVVKLARSEYLHLITQIKNQTYEEFKPATLRIGGKIACRHTTPRTGINFYRGTSGITLSDKN